ncbi:hypothetical protein [Kaarinaea lacus]
MPGKARIIDFLAHGEICTLFKDCFIGEISWYVPIYARVQCPGAGFFIDRLPGNHFPSKKAGGIISAFAAGNMRTNAETY